MNSNNSVSIVSAALLAMAAGATMLLAQWPAHKTEGPRTETGELNLKAPAPKAADGHPDLTGLWQPMRLNLGNAKVRTRGKAAPPVRAPGEPPPEFRRPGSGL